MEKIRINNDVTFNYNVYHNGVPESFIGASGIITKLINEAYNDEIVHTYSIVDNVITVDVLAGNLTKCGVCRFYLSDTKAETFTADATPFELVPTTSDTTIQIGDPINITADI